MGRRTFPTHASEVTLAGVAPIWGPFAAADLILPFIRAVAWRWTVLVHAAIPTRVRAQFAFGWGFVVAVVAVVNEHDADHGVIDVEGAPVDPAPGNAAGAAIPAIEDGPAAESSLMGSLRGILDNETE